jgi:hypothetical protein
MVNECQVGSIWEIWDVRGRAAASPVVYGKAKTRRAVRPALPAVHPLAYRRLDTRRASYYSPLRFMDVRIVSTARTSTLLFFESHQHWPQPTISGSNGESPNRARPLEKSNRLSTPEPYPHV